MRFFGFGKKQRQPTADERKLLVWLSKNGKGYEAIKEVERIVASETDTGFIDQDSHLTPLLLALDSNRTDPEIARIIFRSSPNAWQRGTFGFNTLHGAAKSEEFLEILEFGIKKSPNIDEPMGEESTNTALGLAMMNLNELGARALLLNGASVDASGNAAAAGWASATWFGGLYYKSRLHSYLEDTRKLENSLSLLLSGGLDVNCSCAPHIYQVSMLQAVVDTWNLIGGNAFYPDSDDDFQARKLRLLLHYGADPNAITGKSIGAPYEGSVVHFCRRSEQIVTMLEGGADPYQISSNGRTILHSIAECKDFSPRLEAAFNSAGFSFSKLDFEYKYRFKSVQPSADSLIRSIKNTRADQFIEDDQKVRIFEFLERIIG